ncbi:Uncharacterised protein [Mobiluncus mulieris]|uniref:Uncharacterized protein n=1 Tax=Mobiluncus mulieris TaxID=2052 RepID=A0A8G2M4N0_9ACTO|nr:Uncharacterised protein [Mobiluncus mulieris]
MVASLSGYALFQLRDTRRSNPQHFEIQVFRNANDNRAPIRHISKSAQGLSQTRNAISTRFHFNIVRIPTTFPQFIKHFYKSSRVQHSLSIRLKEFKCKSRCES